jgi:hypothetical protein
MNEDNDLYCSARSPPVACCNKNMPKFVPVVDTEKPISEQGKDPSFDKHRRFDNPHKVDRGWQQGTVGWGVLGEFGSSGKDDGAQIVKRAEGGSKMVKNERGLWVKAKDLTEEDDGVSSKPGRGRGGGVSVLGELRSRTVGATADSHEQEQRHAHQYDDADYLPPSRRKHSLDDDRKRRRSPSTSPPRQRSSRDPPSESDSRRGAPRARSRSRSRSRSADRSRRHDSRDRSSRNESDRRRNDSRDRNRGTDRRDSSRDRNRDRDRRDNSRDRKPNDRQRSDRDSRDRNAVASDPRSDSRNGTTSSGSASSDANVTEPSKREPVKTDDQAECVPAEILHSITAVQVVNRFHDVYAQDTLFQSDRLKNIAQLFTADAAICSLKTGAVYLNGREAIYDSFAKTTAAPTTISKRIYFEQAGMALPVEFIIFYVHHQL